MKVEIIPALNDNYIFIGLLEEANINHIVVDPAQAQPVINYFLKNAELELNYILITHHHWDHIGGVRELKNYFPKAEVILPSNEAEEIAAVCGLSSNGFKRADPKLWLNDYEINVLELPGHTKGHIGFHFLKDNILFCGDTLFSAGCGRIFKTDPPAYAKDCSKIFASLQKIKQLPLKTKIYCAHEYTVNNLKFASYIEEDNPDIKAAIDSASFKGQQNIPTIPGVLSQELLINPFLRTNRQAIKEKLITLGILEKKLRTELEIFIQLRKLKDNFS